MTDRLAENDLVELEKYSDCFRVAMTAGELLSDTEAALDSYTLLRYVPRLIAVARLANEQAERIAELELQLDKAERRIEALRQWRSY